MPSSMSKKTIIISPSGSITIKVEREKHASLNQNMGFAKGSAADTRSEDPNLIKTEIKIEDIDSEESVLPANSSAEGEIKTENISEVQKQCEKCHETPNQVSKPRNAKRSKTEQRECPSHNDDVSIEPFKCTKCKFTTEDSKDIIRHILEHEKADTTVKSEPNDPLETKPTDTKPKKQSKVPSKPQAKPQTSTKDDTTTRGKRPAPVDESDSSSGDEFSSDLIYRCPFCSYRTPDKEAMSQHYVSHHDIPLQVKTFRCHNCNFQCAKRSELVTHMALHKKEEVYKCDLCPYETPRKATMLSHKSIHEMASRKTDYKSAMCLF